MTARTDLHKYLLLTALAGGLAGMANIGFWVTVPRSAFLALVLAWWSRRIYRVEAGEVVGVHPWPRVVAEGLAAGLLAGIPLAGMSWIAYAQGWFKSSDLPGIEQMIIAQPLPALATCLVYGAGLYLACTRIRDSLWQAWGLAVATALLAGLCRTLLSSNSDVRDSWFIVVPVTSLPFVLGWLAIAESKNPSIWAFRNQKESA